ncbi:hypothetical protein [Myxococcus landrumensis]|uniref:DUF2225 domain-containing protein n=1 Tax=Myxococcus landrumensis TaxID=2813577 RepID=A0ABX7NIT7_9BACT|nr:hypothetical protein [Myxococcus landrumus]QSQ17296.1 hypothetical protein JY572_15065 [Myxococcus landrumus]
MTTIRVNRVQCAVCDSVSEQRSLGSTSTFGHPDLDGRPDLLARTTLRFWVQTCPACGYCATSLDDAPAGASEVVHSEAYLAQLHQANTPALANEFLCQALLLESSGDKRGAAAARLHAAWTADDSRDEGLAHRCRTQAADLLLAAPPRPESNAHEDLGWRGWSGVQEVDLYRRAGRSDDARREAERVRRGGVSILVEQLLTYELEALERGDTARHTVGEALGQPSDTTVGGTIEDPLLGYLLRHYGQFATKAEHQAARMNTFKTKDGTRWATEQPELLALLAEGKAGLGRMLERRFLAEHPHEVVLNRCPQCGALARTPLARQCRACPHTWRESAR